MLQGDKIPDELPDELQPDKVPKPLSALPSLNGTTPKVLNAAFAFVLCLILLKLTRNTLYFDFYLNKFSATRPASINRNQ